MKTLALSGPWAELERRQREHEAIIHKLTSEVAQWQAAYKHQEEQLSAEQARRRVLEETSVPQLQNQLASAHQTIEKLVSDFERQKGLTQQAEQSAASAVSVLQSKLETAIADAAVLKNELAKAVQVRQVTASKVDEVRRKLGLGQSEAEYFIRDLDDTKSANKSLRAEVASLTSEKTRLEQQCDSRTSHAMTLIAENKRLIEQVSELRKQITGLDQDLWRTKQDLVAAQRLGAKTAQRRQALAAANTARPEWQSVSARSTASDITDLAHAAGTQAPQSRPSLATDRRASLDTHRDTRGSSDQSKPGVSKAGTHPNPTLKPCKAASNKAAAVASVSAAVQEAAEQLEGLRRAAMQQALAVRQQRLAHSAAASTGQ